jgi:thiamine kinase-like enzyme
MLSLLRSQLSDPTFVQECLHNTPEFVKYLSNGLEWGKVPFRVSRGYELSGGETNLLFSYDIMRIGEPPSSTQICIKRYLPFRRTIPEYEFTPNTNDRGFYELKFSRLFQRCLAGSEAGAVEAICFDKYDNWLVMNKVGNMTEYDQCMSTAEYRLRVGRNLGRAIAAVQNRTPGSSLRWYRPLVATERLEQRCHLARKIALRDHTFSKNLSGFIEESKTSPKCMIHDSFCPKNVFVGKSGRVMLFDFEFSNYGDSAWDPAYMMTHFLIGSIRDIRQRQFLRSLAEAFFESYRKDIVRFRKDFARLSERITRSIGLALLHRSATMVSGSVDLDLADKLASVGNLAFGGEFPSPIDLFDIVESGKQSMTEAHKWLR